MIEILSGGALNSVQDQGRVDHLGIGVSRGGAMDAPALAMANWMVGNNASAAGLEISIFPFRLRVHAPVRFACAGAATRVEAPRRAWPSWWAASAAAGEVLTLAAPTHGARAYLAFAGGIDVPLVLGARATDLKSGFGGVQGRGLRKGDRLRLCRADTPASAAGRAFGIAPDTRAAFATQLAAGTVPIRAMAGAEFDAFTPQAIAALQGTDYLLTPDSNRQGYRLEGAALPTARPLELLSHGIVPGTVQVPPSGQPILQLAEANTCGGYPKIATVIEADLWRLAQLRAGQRLRFVLVDHAAAVAAWRALDEEQEGIRLGLELQALRPALRP